MPKFRRVESVEAMQWPLDSNKGHSEVLDWMGRESPHHMPDGFWIRRVEACPGSVSFNLVGDGVFEANPGDWIVRRPGDQFFALSNDTFTQMYEAAE